MPSSWTQSKIKCEIDVKPELFGSSSVTNELLLSE